MSVTADRSTYHAECAEAAADRYAVMFFSHHTAPPNIMLTFGPCMWHYYECFSARLPNIIDLKAGLPSFHSSSA